MTLEPTPEATRAIAAFIGEARWFGGKGRDFTITQTSAVPVTVAGDASPSLRVHLVEVQYADDGGSPPDVEVYQLPVAYYPEAQQRLAHAFVGWWEDPDLGWVHAYDAVHDRDAMAQWRDVLIDPASAAPGLNVHRVGGEVHSDAQPALFSGEQSNSTVMLGEEAVLKIFRKVTPGRNPDITVHDVLTRADSPHVAHLYGWIETADEVPVQLAMLQEFLRTATDGWELALASVRSLFGDPTTRASDSGGDFAGEATRLGAALGEVHDALREHFPAAPPLRGADLAAAMSGRLEAALAVVPALADYADDLNARFAAIAELGEVPAQQVHGDLHLGQTLRTVSGWKIVDFEGEPAKSLSERQRADSRWRDVAGMLRSFDYAPRVAARSATDLDPAETAGVLDQADQWAERNKNHFLVAYGDGKLDQQGQLLLDAYVADKAIYEVVYETRNRPSWVEVPLAALARMTAPKGTP